MNTLPLKVFITYSHNDLEQNCKLKTCLVGIEDEGKITLWDDNKILPGDEWEKVISDNLVTSDILLYLVSATSLESKNCNKELAEALDFKIRVIPIILEVCHWRNHELSRFEVLPRKGRPTNEWEPESDGWQNVVAGIRKTVEKMQSQSETELCAESAFQQGNVLMMVKQLNMAIKRYSHAIELAPNFADAYTNRGLAYVKKGEIDRGIEDHNKAIELKPDYAEAYFNRGGTYKSKGEIDRAIDDFSAAITLKQDYAAAYTNRGLAYVKKGEIDRGIEDHNKAIELKPDYAEAYFNRGGTYKSKGEIDRAIADFSHAIELDPNFADAYNHRGVPYLDKGDYDLAIGDFTQAIKLKDDAEFYYNRGLAHFKKSDYALAIEDFTRAICRNPKFVHEVYYNRGRAWLHQEEWEKAKSDLQMASEGMDIITPFHDDYGSVSAFEQKYRVKLPPGITALLTPPQA